MSSTREIGGYFELEEFSGSHYHQNAVRLNCGRCALMYLAELREIRRVWVPDWMCSSVPDAFRRAGAEVLTYHIGGDFLPVYDFTLGVSDWMLLMDYYGVLKHQDVEKALEFSCGRLVVDESHGFFRKPWDECDVIYTCRKWFGVADGAYAVTSDGARLDRELPVDESRGRMGFVLGRFERSAGEYYSEASQNNRVFDSEVPKRMSRITDNLMRAIDYARVAERRLENWKTLNVALQNVNQMSIDTPEVPFMYPLLLKGQNALRKKLISRNIFIPLLWPNICNESVCDSYAARLSKDILPLPIDQRYCGEDMNRIALLVKSYQLEENRDA